MGSGDRGSSPLCDGGDGVEDESIRELCEKHQLDLENLTLTAQPFKTLHLFTLATSLYLKRSIVYILSKGGPLVLLCTLVVACGFVLMAFDGPHTQHIEEVIRYLRFGLWWVALGVASSIGLGSGLHTFVLYLGPHIALFTIKATQCGRVDLKSAPYDTIQLKSAPSWLGKDCSKFGPPVFQSMPGSLVRVPLISILRQVQLEAVLWGFGTALGELPPYFISRAARISGSKFNAMEDNKPGRLNQIKIWLLSHSQYLNFFTVLVLASVPNPLFDLAGIMCGQFGIPFWEFFLATLIGKAIIKTHIQTTFIIAVCNNQLLQWLENELIWVLGLIPGLSSVMPTIIAKLHMVREKYLLSSAPAPSNTEAKQWNLSFTLIWNSIVWIVLLNFFVKIVTSTAQRFLKKQQESEMTNKLAQLNYISSSSHANSTPSST